VRPKFVEREQGQGPDFRRRCLVERSGCEAAVHAVAQCVVVLLLLLLLTGKVEIERNLPFEAGGRARNAACALHSPRRAIPLSQGATQTPRLARSRSVARAKVTRPQGTHPPLTRGTADTHSTLSHSTITLLLFIHSPLLATGTPHCSLDHIKSSGLLAVKNSYLSAPFPTPRACTSHSASTTICPSSPVGISPITRRLVGSDTQHVGPS
jgi:hypothetical protein